MPTWKLTPSDKAMESVLKEYIKRRGIDVETKRGQARVRAAHAIIEAIATDNPDVLLPYLGAIEEGDPEALIAVVEDWAESLKQLINERRAGRKEN